MNDKTSLSGATTLRPIDIEKLAEEHLTPFARTGWTAYGEQLKQFAEALLEDKDQSAEIAQLKDNINYLREVLLSTQDALSQIVHHGMEQWAKDKANDAYQYIEKSLSKTPAQET